MKLLTMCTEMFPHRFDTLAIRGDDLLTPGRAARGTVPSSGPCMAVRWADPGFPWLRKGEVEPVEHGFSGPQLFYTSISS